MKQIGWAERDQVLVACELTERALSLPAIPVQDWAQQAANAFTLLACECPLAVGLCQPPIGHEAPIMEDAGVLGADERIDREFDEFTRAQYEHWWLASSYQPGSVVASRPVAELDAETRHLWAQCGASELLFSSSAMNDRAPGRRLVLVMGLTGRALATIEGRLRVLQAVTPRLLARARLAFGTSEPLTRKQRLTAREQLVLEMLVRGSSVREIAETLERSPHTVHDHTKSLHAKLGAKSRGELVARALGRPIEGDEPDAAQSATTLA